MSPEENAELQELRARFVEVEDIIGINKKFLKQQVRFWEITWSIETRGIIRKHEKVPAHVQSHLSLCGILSG